MEEGTGLSLYMLVGSILFGLFVIMVTLMGTDLQAQTSNIITCVQSYVLNEPTDCGDSESNNQIDEPINVIDIRIGPTGDEWGQLTEEERNGYTQDYLNALKQDFPGIEITYFYDRVQYSGGVITGSIYGEFNEEGELVKTYSVGQTHASKYKGQKTIRVNDVRLVPHVVRKSGKQYSYDKTSDYYSRDGYGYWNERGTYEYYLIYKN